MEKTLRSFFLLAPELRWRISSKDLIFVACEILGLLIHLPTPINFFAFVEIPSRAEKEALHTNPRNYFDVLSHHLHKNLF